MEEELKCPVCRRWYCKPLLLPCTHSICTACAVAGQEPSQSLVPHPVSDEGQANGPVIQDADNYPEIDKLSMVSEADSGVVCNSRPNSYLGTPSVSNIFTSSALQSCPYGLRCPVCNKIVLLDDFGALSLPTNKVLEAIVEKYTQNKQPKKVEIKCELCVNGADIATAMCEQCEVFYCDTCRDNCHPSRGSLAKHNLVDPTQGKNILQSKKKRKEAKCKEHSEELLSMFCVGCKIPVCYVCSQDGRHINHDVQSLSAMCKAQKVSRFFFYRWEERRS
ncbi:hypothetical protein SNE40_011124 [Patella caerulea]|uniref:B box-type domain-containing protein n=1 Tax=Patella caerulea TaxID=87958 RepID=A0AAN8JW00_PATCE